MFHRTGARLLAVLLPASLLLAPLAASAASLTVEDAAGDAKAINMGAAFGEISTGTTAEGPYFLDAPDETSTDVVRTTIDHAEKRLTLTMQFRDLVDTDGHTIFFRVFTPKGRYDLGVASFGGETMADLSPGRGQMVVFSDGNSATIDSGSKPCRTVRARFDLAADSLTVSAPTKCLGSPKWVQIAGGVSRSKVTPQADGSVNIAGFVDDAFRSGVSMKSLGRSAKVRRG
jgi:hypothetical protein